MKSRDAAIRRKRFQIEERRRQVGQIETMIEEFGRMVGDLDMEIAAEHRRTGIEDEKHFAYSTFARVDRDGGRPPTIGRPVAGTRAYLLDRHLRPVPAGVAGELCLGGAGLARGYLDRPELTAERFVPDPFAGRPGCGPGARLFRSGDLARWRPDGSLELLGRIDRQLKIRGLRIEPGEVEAVLASHPAVAECVVGADPTASRLVAWVVPRAGAALAAAELRRYLEGLLPASLVPAVFTHAPGTVTVAATAAAEKAHRMKSCFSSGMLFPPLHSSVERRLVDSAGYASGVLTSSLLV